MRLTRMLPVALTLAAAACGGGATDGPQPAAIVAVSANPVAGAQVATTLPGSPTFEVRSASGEALGGVAVTVTVGAGGGSIAGAPSASEAGPTPIGTWTLGAIAGPQTVTVAVAGVAPLVFTTIATPGPAVALQIIEGNNQVAPASTVVAGPMRVRVRDGFGNAVPGATVTWTIGTGGGSVAAGTSIADAQGVATAPSWTLGASGDQQLVASVGAFAVTFVALHSAYNIVIRYVGAEPTTLVRQAFESAAARIKSVITGDVPDIAMNHDLSCGLGGGTVSETVDDIVIYAQVVAIDGVGGALGSAGFCWFRQSSQLPISGGMRFDSADLDNLLAQGRLENVILHEMLHVIGVGTAWELKGLMSGVGTPSSAFTGALARLACVNDNGGAVPCNSAVPAENCLDLPIGQDCGEGTQDSHWKESTFGNELMTGYLGTGSQPLSRMTVQSLADLGYEVNASLADAYMVPAPGLKALLAWSEPTLRMPPPMRPRFGVDDAGRVVRVMP